VVAAAPPNTSLQVSVPTGRLCLQRKSVTFNLKNVSGGQIDVGVSVERQADSGEWQFVQESVGTACASKTARVWRLGPGQEDRAVWSGRLAGDCFRSGRYRVIGTVNSVVPVADASPQYSRVVGPEFVLEQCK
jgi:hypothetical protein